MVRNSEAMISTVMDRCIEFLERDTRAVQIVSYGVTSVGLLIALRRIRPFAKFTKPSDVPSRFIETRIPLRGKAAEIEPTRGALIMVDHEPLINIPRFGTTLKYLPVKVAGINITNHGVSWLQTVVRGKKIVFVPLARKNDYLDCTINLEDPKEIPISIGEELVRLGFGTVDDFGPETTKDERISAYRITLIRAQKRAKRDRNGYWHFTINPSLVWKLQNYVNRKLSHALPARISRQLNLS